MWLTEFGWDATTKPAPPTGDFAKWIGSTETEQAMWIVRGYMVLCALGVDRAYLYFFNADDTPHLHGSSGLTRNFVPKPAFYAVAHLQKTLGDYRLTKVVREDSAHGFVYEFTKGDDAKKRVLAVWKTAGAAVKATVPVGAAKVLRAERTPLATGDAPRVAVQSVAGGIEVEAGELPVFVWLED